MTNKKLTFDRLRTLAVHGPQDETGVPVDDLVAPIHRSSTYRLGNPESFDDIRYIRLNNTPTQVAAERLIGAICGGSALMTPSGTSAIHIAFGLLQPGDHMLVPKRIYGGTQKILELLKEREGLTSTAVDMNEPESWESALTEKTRGFYLESIANPWMSVGDLSGAAQFAREHDLLSIVDNTFATPMLYRPLEHGFDISLHSASKHLNGHSDVVAGVLISDDARCYAMRKYANRIGVCPDPQAAYLLARGVKTLPLRVAAQCESAMQLAQFLSSRDDIEEVNYAGLESDPSHESAKAIFEGGYGSMLAFTPTGGAERAKKLIELLTIPMEAPSLGGAESLVTRPVTTSHAGLDEAYRKSIGIHDAMIRVSVGIEASSELIADFARALTETA